MASNARQGGTKGRYRKPDSWYYDQLPPTAREALANAMFSWSAAYFYGQWKRGKLGFRSGSDIAVQVATADRITIKKLTIRR